MSEEILNHFFVKNYAKLIISGEHSVIYNKLALGVRLEQFYSIYSISYNKDLKGAIVICGIIIETEKLINKKDKSYRLKESLTKNCQNDLFFINAILIITEEMNIDINLITNIEIKEIKNNIPQSLGLGSSGNISISLTQLFAKYFNIDLNKSQEFEVAKKIENLIHTKGSGIDIMLIQKQGLSLIKNSEYLENINFSEKLLYIINTGNRNCTSGDVVNYVKQQNIELTIWNEFEQVAMNLFEAIKEGSEVNINNQISINNELLTRLNIIPNKVLNFIEELKGMKIYAKLSGAGTVDRDSNSCGLLFVYGQMNIDQINFLSNITKKYRYSVIPSDLDC